MLVGPRDMSVSKMLFAVFVGGAMKKIEMDNVMQVPSGYL